MPNAHERIVIKLRESGDVHAAIVHALTRYDMLESKKRYYNCHALALYFEALDRAEAFIKRGIAPREAYLSSFCGRVLAVVLKAAGLEKATKDEEAAHA